MFLAILDFTTDPADRDRAMAQLAAERPAVRAMPGCVDMRAFAAPDDGSAVTVLHEWDDHASFAAYLESDAFARSGVVLRPLMTTSPRSRRFRAELLETVV